MKLYKLWCEYDYGQDTLVSYNKSSLIRWFNSAFLSVEGEDWDREYFGAEENESPFEMMDRQGLVAFTDMELV